MVLQERSTEASQSVFTRKKEPPTLKFPRQG